MVESPRMNPRIAARAAVVCLLAVGVMATTVFFGAALGRRYESNQLCCQVPRWRNVSLSLQETLRLVSFPSQIGQDKWVLKTVFPGLTDGFFVDVGSGDGIAGSNTFALERQGWTGICIDPFPSSMESRTCQLFKAVVFSEPGLTVTFHPAGQLGGITDTLDTWKAYAEQYPPVELTTVTLGDILDRANAPDFIHFRSLDIEGAELDALRGVPFDRYRFGAFAIEHTYEGSKRADVAALLTGHGYRRVHTWYQDDFYLPDPDHPRHAR